MRFFFDISRCFCFCQLLIPCESLDHVRKSLERLKSPGECRTPFVFANKYSWRLIVYDTRSSGHYSCVQTFTNVFILYSSQYLLFTKFPKEFRISHVFYTNIQTHICMFENRSKNIKLQPNFILSRLYIEQCL